MEAFGPVVLRVTVGAMFVAHGLQKLFGVWDGGGLSGTAAHFASLGLTPAFPLAVAVGVTESAGGAMLLAGVFTRSAAVALTMVMLVAIYTVHWPHGFFLNWGLTPGQGHGFEFSLIVVGALLCLILTGPGALSIDHARARSAEADAAGRARLRGKL
jgi:putative oxidoreductase